MDKRRELDRLYAEYARTPVLQKVAAGKRLVKGAGPLDSPLVVVGEAPGEEEARLGEPFVGRSGQYLQSLFEAADLPWDLCYRTNVLPWRPDASNRTPYPFEVANSQERLRAEIAVIGPSIVVTAGATAWHGVTRGEHGEFAAGLCRLLDIGQVSWQLMAVHHPAYLLRLHGRERDEMQAETIRALQAVMVRD